jgi:hypothetical protein
MTIPTTATINVKVFEFNPKKGPLKPRKVKGIMTVKVKIPSYELVCKKMFYGFTKTDWLDLGMTKDVAIAKAIADPVIKKGYDKTITSILNKKYAEERDFDAQSLGSTIFEQLSPNHWLPVAVDNM